MIPGIGPVINKFLDEYQKCKTNSEKEKIKRDVTELAKKFEFDQKNMMKRFSSETYLSSKSSKYSKEGQSMLPDISSELKLNALISPKKNIYKRSRTTNPQRKDKSKSQSRSKSKYKQGNNFEERKMVVGFNNDKFGKMSYLRFIKSTDFKQAVPSM